MDITVRTTDPNDAALVAGSLTGNRDAFGQIVARYQTLICSMAYSSTGSLSQSEDLAQETFVAAWKQLASLREPHKLRSWLCGIARNRICDALKKQGREPSHAAEPLDALQESPAPEPPPHDLAISCEEQAILWRSLERIPDTYREPLVLFYREHQSIENVAAALELSEDAVKQRLSRGRKLLHEQVLAFVEGALEMTRPGKTFTLGVVAALPLFVTTASAATAGIAATQASTGIKGTGIISKALLMTKVTKTTIGVAVVIAMIAIPTVLLRVGSNVPPTPFKRLVGTEVSFTTTEPAPDGFQAWSFYWNAPAVNGNMDFVLMAPEGKEYYRTKLSEHTASLPIQSDFWPATRWGDARVFYRQPVKVVFLSTNGQQRWDPKGQYYFAFFRTEHDQRARKPMKIIGVTAESQ